MESAWAGLRPQSNHEAPYMGEHEEIKVYMLAQAIIETAFY